MEGIERGPGADSAEPVVDDHAPPSTGSAAVAGRPRWWRPTVTLPAAVMSVFFVAGIVHLTRDWYPYGDWAVAELVIRNTDRYLPLSGPYSAQRGYDHPLPLVYAIQWLPYHLFGERSSAGLATTIWWNGAWLAFLAWMLARRRAPWLAVAAIATVPVMAANVESGSLILPWNPSLALVPGMVLVFVAWQVAMGSRRLLPVAAGLAVWCTGAHLGFAPLAISVSVAACVGLVATTLRRGGRSALVDLVRPALLAAVTATILATPLLVDLVANGDESNPVHIVERGRPDPDAATVPTDELAKVLRAELAVPPAWATPRPPYSVFLHRPADRFPTVLVVAVVAALAAVRRKAHDEVVAMGIGLLGTVAATAGLANVEAGTLQPWYLLSIHAASMAFCAVTAWSVARSVGAALASFDLRPRGRPFEVLRWALPPVAVLVAALLVVPSLHIQPHAPDVDGPSLEMAAAVQDRYEPGTRLVFEGPVAIDGYFTQSVVLLLDRAGYDVRVPDEHLYLYSPSLEAPDDRQGTHLVLQLSHGDLVPPHPGATLITAVPVSHPIYVAAEEASVWEVPTDP